MTLTELQRNWTDTPEYHKAIHENFCELVKSDNILHEHRKWVKDHVFGFGADSFPWLWKLLLAELSDMPILLELGVFRGKSISLWRLLRPDALVTGITPLSTDGGMWDSDYAKDIATIHAKFALKHPHIIPVHSQSERALNSASAFQWDLIYVDGDHTYEGALADLNNYSPLVKVGGFLVIDDCACDMHMEFGYFQGIQSVQDAFDTWMQSDMASNFEFVCNVVHLRVMRRVK